MPEEVEKFQWSEPSTASPPSILAGGLAVISGAERGNPLATSGVFTGICGPEKQVVTAAEVVSIGGSGSGGAEKFCVG